MIYLIEKVLPESYFANNLTALAVDMAVFRDLMRVHVPELAQHLDRLQLVATEQSTTFNTSCNTLATLEYCILLHV